MFDLPGADWTWGRTDLDLANRLNHLNNGGGYNGQETFRAGFTNDAETDVLQGVIGRTVWVNPATDLGIDRFLTGNIAANYGRTAATAAVLYSYWSFTDYGDGTVPAAASSVSLGIESLTGSTFHGSSAGGYAVDGIWDAGTQTVRFRVASPGGSRSYAGRVQLDASGRRVMANLALGTDPVRNAERREVR